jgi:hypothetical protein
MSESLGFEVELPLAFAAAMDATRDALKAEGFGILTEIDLQAAFLAATSGRTSFLARVIRRSHSLQSRRIPPSACSCRAM